MLDVTVIIPSKTTELVDRAVRSIRRTHTGGNDIDIVVIDDGIDRKAIKDANIRYVAGTQPFCFARNVNMGLLACSDTSDVFLMNDDTYFISGNGLHSFHAITRECDRVGLLTPVFTRAERTPCQRLGIIDPALTVWMEKTRYLTFAAVYISRELLREIGQFDETFTGYGYEDNDYCLRAKLAGFQLGVAPGIAMAHGDLWGRASATFRDNPDFVDLCDRNKRLFLEKWARLHIGLSVEDTRRMIEVVDML